MTLILAALVSLTIATDADAQLSGLKATANSYTDAAKDVAAPGDISQESIVQSFLAANDLVNETNAVML